MHNAKALILIVVLMAACAMPSYAVGEEHKTMLVHLKTSLNHDDAQICVAYNVIWAALRDGYKVDVLVDSDAVYTFKVGWRGRDDIERYELPDNLRKELSEQFKVPMDEVPATYGGYLTMLHELGARFYINRGMLIVSKLGTPEDPLKKISAKFFIPATLTEIIQMQADADVYMAY